jgi:hypothetical protein
MIKFLIKLLTYLLPKHKFAKGTLVYKDGTRTLYEVDENYYNTDFDPVTIVRPYPMGKQVFGVDKHDILEFMEHKKPLQVGYSTTESDVAITAHDNLNFAKKGKK